MSLTSGFQCCCQSAKTCPDDENVDACTRICADWCELHCFIFGDRAEDSAVSTIGAGVRIDPDQAFETHVGASCEVVDDGVDGSMNAI